MEAGLDTNVALRRVAMGEVRVSAGQSRAASSGGSIVREATMFAAQLLRQGHRRLCLVLPVRLQMLTDSWTKVGMADDTADRLAAFIHGVQ